MNFPDFYEWLLCHVARCNECVYYFYFDTHCSLHLQLTMIETDIFLLLEFWITHVYSSYKIKFVSKYFTKSSVDLH